MCILFNIFLTKKTIIHTDHFNAFKRIDVKKRKHPGYMENLFQWFRKLLFGINTVCIRFISLRKLSTLAVVIAINFDNFNYYLWLLNPMKLLFKINLANNILIPYIGWNGWNNQKLTFDKKHFLSKKKN